MRQLLRSILVRDAAFYAEKMKQSLFAFNEVKLCHCEVCTALNWLSLQEDLRPYFPLPRVLNGASVHLLLLKCTAFAGLFKLAEKLFGKQLVCTPQNQLSRCSGIVIRPAKNEQTWHPDVQYFEVRSLSRSNY